MTESLLTVRALPSERIVVTSQRVVALPAVATMPEHELRRERWAEVRRVLIRGKA